MSLLDTIRRIFEPRQAADTTTIDDASAATAAKKSDVSALTGGMAADTERRSVVTTCRKMYHSDPRARGVIKTMARDTVKGGFTVKAPNNPEAEQVANDMVTRLNLAQKLDDYVRLTLRDGDSFLQVGVNAQNEIAKLVRMPTLQMHRNSNEQDSFDNPRQAYWLANDLWMGDSTPGSDAVWFSDWQIIHARWDHDDGKRNGSPLFESATGAWKRVNEGEIDTAVRRKTRSGMKYLHVLEDANPDDIEKYKLENQDALDNPFAAVADFFSNRAGSIQVIQGDANLGQMEDVMHHIRTWWVASPVPMSLLGYGQDLNRDVLEEQTEQYDRALEQLTQWVESDFVRPLLERQWLLAGILPDGLEYQLVWQVKQNITAADLRDAADAALRLMTLGLPAETVWTIMGRFLPGIDLSALTQAAGNIADTGDAGQGQNDSSRMADTAERMIGQVQ